MAHRNSPSRTTSALRVAQFIFTRSAGEPTTLWLNGKLLSDCRRFLKISEIVDSDEPPSGRILLMPLRDLLLRPTTTTTVTRDAVWRERIARARSHESWLVAAIGMAMPRLRRAVRQLAVGMAGDRDDLEPAVAEGFVIALHKVDLADTSLCARLVTAARKAGAKQLYKDATVDAAVWSEFASRAPPTTMGHPDFVLLDAVAAGVLSMPEAWLIGVTRLDTFQSLNSPPNADCGPTPWFSVAAGPRSASVARSMPVWSRPATTWPSASCCHPLARHRWTLSCEPV